MDVNGFITKLFETELPEGYSFSKVEMNVSASDSQEGGRLFFRGGDTAAKVTLEKGGNGVTQVSPSESVVWNEELPKPKLTRLYHCGRCGKNYGRKLGKTELPQYTTCKECKTNVERSDKTEEEN